MRCHEGLIRAYVMTQARTPSCVRLSPLHGVVFSRELLLMRTAIEERLRQTRFHYNRKGEQELNDAGVAAMMDAEAETEKLDTGHANDSIK